MKLKLAIMAFALTCSMAFAQQAYKSPVAMALSCRSYLKANNRQANAALEQVYGYIFEYNNSGTSDIFVPPKPYTFKLDLDKFCRNNPQKSIQDAATTFITDLDNRKTRVIEPDANQ